VFGELQQGVAKLSIEGTTGRMPAMSEPRRDGHGTLPGRRSALIATVLLALCIKRDAAGLVILSETLGWLPRGTAPRELFAFGFRALIVATSVAFLIWLYGAYKNLSRLDVSGCRYSPLWAVTYFFIPLVNLFRPYQVAQELWKGSGPKVALHDELAWRRGGRSLLVVFWWACFLPLFVLALLPSAGGMPSLELVVIAIARRKEDMTSADIASLLISVGFLRHGLSLLAAALAIAMIWSIRNRQTEKYSLLRRASLPQEVRDLSQLPKGPIQGV
jgi:hypothetical protein